MSEQAPETPAGRGRAPSGGGNVFTRRIGPLPMWQWLLIATAMIAVYVIFEYRKKNKPANTAAGTQAGGAGDGQVPQFVNQTNTYVSPPSAPTMPPGAVNPSGTPPAAGGHAAPLTVQYAPGGYPGGVGAGAGMQTSGAAFNYSTPQIQQLGFPNLRGLTLTEAKQALAGYAGGRYSINTVSGNQSGRIVSFTPYSTGQVNIGLS